MLKTQEEREKFCSLYEEYKGLLYVMAYSILKDDRAAEDAVFGAFCKAAECIGKFEEPISEQSKKYLVGLVESKALETVRARDGAEEEVPAENAEGAWVECSGCSTIAKCVCRLPVRYRALLILKYGHGFTCQEIGRVMGLSGAAVRVLNKRAKERLAKLCVNEGVL